MKWVHSPSLQQWALIDTNPARTDISWVWAHVYLDPDHDRVWGRYCDPKDFWSQNMPFDTVETAIAVISAWVRVGRPTGTNADNRMPVDPEIPHEFWTKTPSIVPWPTADQENAAPPL